MKKYYMLLDRKMPLNVPIKTKKESLYFDNLEEFKKIDFKNYNDKKCFFSIYTPHEDEDLYINFKIKKNEVKKYRVMKCIKSITLKKFLKDYQIEI